ncbi:TonB-dependent receptor [Geobacter sp. FeAm09]|uniref:TonB-dependent receptor plug domain-containing protein n=1 Tax=Geobacter sp. FeAm09 TaxID=2597769 RepID=UPI0011EEE5EA|nr:TonB-dependent receptor plug domain-containing protein [Geobacter sp. FeAm09]QEM68046.1 TonB-dependent receptor [Geobacter sp. FeAm09]
MNKHLNIQTLSKLLDIQSLFLLISRARNPNMSLVKPQHTISTFLVFLCLVLGALPYLAWGEEPDETLGLFSAWQEEASTASRAPKPLSQTAENVTVITSADIEAINAHTLADVLATIPGIQTQQRGGPGGQSFTLIQSSDYNHVLVLVDGVAINTSGNFADTALIPARVIERIEIVKGAGSSSWGQALGGVISVTTHSPEQGRKLGGTADASLGERGTTDTGLSLSGNGGPVGYYLSGGYLGSGGLLSYHSVYSRNIFGRLTWDIPGQGQMWGNISYIKTDNRGDLYVPEADSQEKENAKQLTASVGLHKALTGAIDFEAVVRHLNHGSDYLSSAISTGAADPQRSFRDRVYGGEIKLTWREENNLLVIGGVYEQTEADLAYGSNTSFVKIKHHGFYLNDTLNIGTVSIIPGARFDRTTGRTDTFSPSLGLVWRLTEGTLLRGYTGLGYSLRDIANTNVERIWTTQIGIESQSVPYLWLKGTLFRNQKWDIQTYNFATNSYYAEKQVALGTEIEARTIPVWNTSLGAGYTFTETTRSLDGSQVYGLPRHTVQLSLHYDDTTFRGVLTGRHIWWNQDPSYLARYYGLVWDLHLGATIFKRERNAVEVFFSGHNLFNGAQFNDSYTPNPSRWFEGGMRVRF